MVRVVLVAPAMSAPLRRHWNLGGGEPLAAMVKVALSPADAVVLVGWLEIDRLQPGWSTSIAAAELCVVPQAPVARTLYEPASEICTASMVRVAVVVPWIRKSAATGSWFRRHS
jgi:hypothetical protein